MSKSNSGITVEKELRPCVVKTKIPNAKDSGVISIKALFHCWNTHQDIIPPSPMMGGHSGGQIKYILGIVEYEDGAVHECYPHEIRFIDGKINQYCFE